MTRETHLSSSYKFRKIPHDSFLRKGTLLPLTDEALKVREVGDPIQGLSHHSLRALHCFRFSRAGLHVFNFFPGCTTLLGLMSEVESPDSSGAFLLGSNHYTPGEFFLMSECSPLCYLSTPVFCWVMGGYGDEEKERGTERDRKRGREVARGRQRERGEGRGRDLLHTHNVSQIGVGVFTNLKRPKLI